MYLCHTLVLTHTAQHTGTDTLCHTQVLTHTAPHTGTDTQCHTQVLTHTEPDTGTDWTQGTHVIYGAVKINISLSCLIHGPAPVKMSGCGRPELAANWGECTELTEMDM